MKKSIISFYQNTKPAHTYLALIAFFILAVFCIIITGYYIYCISSVPLTAEGIIDYIHVHRPKGRMIYTFQLNGKEYDFYRKTNSNRTFGLKDEYSWNDFEQITLSSAGLPAKIEYYHHSSNGRTILSLSLDGIEYIEYDAAVQDHLTIRLREHIISIVALIVTIILFIFSLKMYK